MFKSVCLCVFAPKTAKGTGVDVVIVKPNWQTATPKDSFVKYVGKGRPAGLYGADVVAVVTWGNKHYRTARKLVLHGQAQ